MKFISGTTSPSFYSSFIRHLQNSSNMRAEFINRNLESFPDGERKVEILDNVYNEHVCVIQSTHSNDSLIELFLILSALKNLGAQKITTLIPYYGYSRQDRSVNGSPISAKLISDLLAASGSSEIVTLDLHCSQITGYSNLPVFNLSAINTFADNIKKHISLEAFKSDWIIVSPDAGGMKRARKLADLLNSQSVAVIEKHRSNTGTVESIQVAGNIKGKHCLIIDDIIDGASTICAASNILKENGALSVQAFGTHGIFSGKALDKIKNSNIDKIVVTNSIEHKNLQCNKINQIDTSQVFSSFIHKILK